MSPRTKKYIKTITYAILYGTTNRTLGNMLGKCRLPARRKARIFKEARLHSQSAISTYRKQYHHDYSHTHS